MLLEHRDIRTITDFPTVEETNEMTTNQGPLESAADNLLNDAEQLIWALLDEQISAADLKRLESLISDDDEVRNRYLECVKLHTDLAEHLGGATAIERITEATDVADSPVLRSLGDIGPRTDSWPPVAD